MPMGTGTYGSKVGRPKKRKKMMGGSMATKKKRMMYKKGKTVKKKELTKRQKDTLKKHSVHHTAKHMAMMRKLMREGSTFTAAHKKAQKTVGK
tara:strand:+ start:1075 stop:1353 length:279 start_codon:yes stop_codon:yes gene_type:complete